MKNMLRPFIITIALAAILFSCKTPELPDVYPYQKRADILAESQNIDSVQSSVFEIARLYDGFVKSSDIRKNETGKYNNASYDVKVPYRFFFDYLDRLRKDLGSSILEEKISDEDSYIRVYESTNEQIDKLKKDIELLEESDIWTSDVDDRIVARYDIDKKKKDLEDLNNKRLSLLEDMNYSTVSIKWRLSGKSDYEEVVMANEDEAVAGIQPIREVVFDRYYQTESIGMDEPVKIVFRGLDPEKTDLISKVDFDKNQIDLTTVPFGKKEKIILDTKCQIINVGIGPLPEIEVDGDVNLEQVVITPRVDDACDLIGYEIRAGTVESGCTKGRKNLKRFNDCFKSKTYRKNGSFIKPKKKILKDEDLKWFYLFPKD